MHLELTEILACPDCGPGHGLIAFVDRLEERRIVRGRLDCPMCERRHEIRDGIVHLARDSEGSASGDVAGSRREPPAPGGAGGGGLPDDAAAVASALLGPPQGSEVLLLALGARALAPAIAELRPEAAVVTFGDPPPAASGDFAFHARVHPVVSAGAGGLPFRSGVLDGALLSGSPTPSILGHVVRALSPGGRLVVLSPAADMGTTVAALEEVEELAVDPRAWVGSRL